MGRKEKGRKGVRDGRRAGEKKEREKNLGRVCIKKKKGTSQFISIAHLSLEPHVIHRR